MIKINILAPLLLFASVVFAQNTTTLDAALAAALQNSPTQKAAILEVQSKTLLEKNARKLPNPELNAESPTGEFYALGVSQSFEWPTVYGQQKKLAKAETALAQIGQRVGENELRFVVRTRYLEAQVADFRTKQLAARDSLYQNISTAATRQFDAGEIDFLQKTLAENEVGKARQARLVSEKMAVSARNQLSILTGLDDLGTLSPLETNLAANVSTDDLNKNPNVLREKQAAIVAEQQIEVVKSRALPNFSLGYLNQGPRSTPLDYRFRASVGIPLWVGQNRTAVRVAEAEAQAAHERADAQKQSIALELQRAQTAVDVARENVAYFQREALPRSRSLIGAATRLREAGQIDYVSFLRTLDEAFAIERDYTEQLEVFQLAHFQHLFLLGQ
jgi:outer membrane protein, heavy metal efflux system